MSAIEEILRDSDDPELEAEFSHRASELRTELERSSLLLLLNEPYDSSNAILMVHAGSGGLDSQDWAGECFCVCTCATVNVKASV